ncbi:MAG: PKD domain-containing protein [Ferruginibacter sp.]
MISKIKLSLFILAAAAFVSCKKTKYEFGELKAPANLVLNTTVVGASAGSPAGDGSGTVQVNVKADNALTYIIDFGDGEHTNEKVPSGDISFNYTATGTHIYTITVNAVGTGGILSTVSKTVTVYFAYVIPDEIKEALTGGTARTWVCDKEATGHFGVGPADAFAPIWYAAGPNSRLPCSYDDEITFTQAGENTIDMEVNNFGQSFAIGASAAFYGLSSAEDCRDIDPGGKKTLAFMPASSASTPDNSTRVQFTVPGNGLIIFGTGAVNYEILKPLSATSITIRNIGIDGNSWYQKLKAK